MYLLFVVNVATGTSDFEGDIIEHCMKIRLWNSNQFERGIKKLTWLFDPYIPRCIFFMYTNFLIHEKGVSIVQDILKF